VYIVLRLIFTSMVLGFNGEILVPLNLDMIVFLVSVWSRALFTQLANVTLFGFV